MSKARVPSAGSPLRPVSVVTSPRSRGPDTHWTPRWGRYWTPGSQLQTAHVTSGQLALPGLGSFQGSGVPIRPVPGEAEPPVSRPALLRASAPSLL